jgi:glyoxylase-like metal-dependent hydrolase (beta-lactamase superfamily II)
LVRDAAGARIEEAVVVNTHFHGDHVRGDGAFVRSAILCSARTQTAA